MEESGPTASTEVTLPSSSYPTVARLGFTPSMRITACFTDRDEPELMRTVTLFVIISSLCANSSTRSLESLGRQNPERPRGGRGADRGAVLHEAVGAFIHVADGRG